MAIRIPQTRESSLPETTGIRTPGADAFGAGVGKAVSGLGKTLEDIALDLQHTENVTKARETETWYKQQMNDLESSYTQKQGKDAFGAINEYTKNVDELRKQSLERLDNHRQKQMFMPVADNRMLAAKKLGNQHAVVSLKRWEGEQLSATLQMNTEDAMRTYGTEAYSRSIQASMQNIEDIAEHEGWSPKQVTIKKIETQSAVLAKIISDAAVSDPGAAKAIFEKEKEKLLTDDRIKAEKLVTAYGNEARAFAVADSLAAQFDPNSSEMQDALRNVDPEIRDRVRAEVAYQGRAREQAKQYEYREQARANWKKLYDGQGNVSLKDLPPYESVTDAQYKAMQNYVEHVQVHGIVAADDHATKLELQTELLADPQAFINRDLDLLRDKLTKKTVDDLQEKQALAAHSPADPKLQDYRTKAEVRADAIRLAGFSNPKSDGASEFSLRVDLALSRAAAVKQRDLTDAEEMEIVNQQVYLEKTKMVTHTGMLWNTTDNITSTEFVASDGMVWPSDFVYRAVKAAEAEAKRSGLLFSKELIQKQLDKYEADFLKP